VDADAQEEQLRHLDGRHRSNGSSRHEATHIVSSPEKNDRCPRYYGANLYHDTFEAIGQKHYMGSPLLDDVQLRKSRVDRIYDVLADEDKFYKLDNRISMQFAARLLDNVPILLERFFTSLESILRKQRQRRTRLCLTHIDPESHCTAQH